MPETRPPGADRPDCDLLIVGAGPAGVSAALWARSQGLEPLLIEGADLPGGQLHLVHFHPRELPGVVEGDGPAIARSFARQLDQARVAARFGARATGIAAAGRGVRLELASGETLEAKAALIATGARRCRLDIPGEREFEERGVSFSATKDRDRFAGQHVVVVGGGDAGYENALLLAEVGCRVTLAVRGAPSARREFRARVTAEPRIEVLDGTIVTAFSGGDRLERVSFATDSQRFERSAAGAVIKIGSEPNSEWCGGAIERDARGFILVDRRFRTRLDRVWAAGDVIGPELPAIAVAIGHAATAVADIRERLSG